MPSTTKTNRNSAQTQGAARAAADGAEQPREITRDIVEYLTEYARENPTQAALVCLGVGFVLGWKLKPW